MAESNRSFAHDSSMILTPSTTTATAPILSQSVSLNKRFIGWLTPLSPVLKGAMVGLAALSGNVCVAAISSFRICIAGVK